MAREAALVAEARTQALAEVRTSLENPQTPLSFPAEWLLDIWNGGRTDSGIRVSELTALQVSDVYACVDGISSAIASRPIKIFERLEVGGEFKRHAKRLAIEHPLFDLLRYAPNEEMTSFTFFKTLQCHALLWGNGYAELQRDNAARIVALWPRNPARTRPVRIQKTGKLVYKTTEGMSQPWWDESGLQPERTILAEDMLFIPGMSLDGRIGQGTVWLARQVIGIALAAEKFAAKFFANGAQPGGVLEHPGTLKPDARETMKRSWMEAQGGENVHRVAILENGIKFSKIGSTPNEAQMIEARNQQRSQVASIFHYPITMLGETGASRANAEQVALEFVNYTLHPWIECWEQEAKRKLLNPPSTGRNANRSFIAVIDTRGLTLPDARSKQGYYTSMRQWSWGCANDVREMEDLNPIEGEVGEGYLVPVNMSLVDASGRVLVAPMPKPGMAPNAALGGSSGTPKPPEAAPDGKDSLRAALWPAFRDAFGRFAARKEHNLDVADKIFGPVLNALSATGCDLGGVLRRLADLSERRLLPEWVNESADEQWRLLNVMRNAQASHLYLARHGATDHTDSDLPDHTGDYSLNKRGRKQAEALGRYVAAKLPKLAAIAGPDLKRNIQTMQEVAKVTGAHIDIDHGLNADGELSVVQVSSLVAFINRYLLVVAEVGPVLLVLSHHAIRAYVNYLRGGSAERLDVAKAACASVWSVDRDGKDAKLIFDPSSE